MKPTAPCCAADDRFRCTADRERHELELPLCTIGRHLNRYEAQIFAPRLGNGIPIFSIEPMQAAPKRWRICTRHKPSQLKS